MTNDLRRTILWIIFISSIVFLWDGWQRHTGKPGMFGTPIGQQAPQAGASANGAAQGSAQASARPASAAAVDAGIPQSSQNLPAAGALPGAAAPPQPAAPVVRSEKITVSTDVLRAVVDTKGGDLVQLELLKHLDHEGKGQPVRLMDLSSERLYLAQTGLIGGDFPNHTTVMTARPGARELGSADALTLTLESPEAGGLKLVKSYTFKRGSYLVDVRHEVVNVSGQPLAPKLYLQLVRDGNKPGGAQPAVVEAFGVHTFTGPAVYTDAKKFQKIEFSDIEKGKAQPEAVASDGWVAMVQHYFVSAWVPKAGTARENFVRKVDLNKYAVGSIVALPPLAADQKAAVDTQLYAGPQYESALEKIAPGLELVKDYGWFTIFAKPLFWLLEKLHALIGNWGWAIVALTFLVKLAFYPLQNAAYKSMANMKKVAPRMTEIRERYKDEPQRMNQAMMELYRNEKVNPFGGCLPILIQIPIFIALYWVLLSSVEMRGAPWLGWIRDLSQMDPYFILPAVMTASMFLQVKLNPTPPDPMQAKLMWIMPAVFSIFFFFFPAGLVLYWITNNVLSIAQQWYINKKLGVA
jgi:YidC/Oxa1 family membrane protein insertase